MLRLNVLSVLTLALLALPACGSSVDSGGGEPTGAPPQNQSDTLCNDDGSMPCGEGFYCDHPIDTMCGAIVDEAGTCKPKLEACDQNLDPVCGCDGQTHGNACMANLAGTAVASAGACPQDQPDTLCNDDGSMPCGEGFYCDHPIDTMCGAIVDEAGTCKPKPEACDDNYDPVCGCDGQTHGNACAANLVGTAVASAGACP